MHECFNKTTRIYLIQYNGGSTFTEILDVFQGLRINWPDVNASPHKYEAVSFTPYYSIDVVLLIMLL